MNNVFRDIILCTFFLWFIASCQVSESLNSKASIDEVVVGLSVEPSSINPILATTTLEREIFQYVFIRLADYDYETLELKPILLEAIPEGQETTDGEFEGLTSFTMRIRDEAIWDDGSPVTGEDVLFTYKMASHPNVPSSSWKEVTKLIRAIKIDESDPKSFTFYSEELNFQTLEYFLSTEIFQRSFYDPAEVLTEYTFSEINDPLRHSDLEQDSLFSQAAQIFSSLKYRKENVSGAGPYKLEKWESGQYIVLKKKDQYWGNNVQEIDQLEAYPNRIIFQFISDPNTVLTLLKNDEIDVVDLSKIPFKSFDDLKADTSFASDYNFYTPRIPRYLILLMNNEDNKLKDREVRRALAHATDSDRIIRQLQGGYAGRINSPIYFTKQEYNDKLPMIDYNLEKAAEILDMAGWKDSDGNGIRDKIVDGKKEELNFTFHITGSEVSTSLYNILNEACNQIGIKISSITKPFGATRLENLTTGDYDMTIMLKTLSPVRRDLYVSYHSTAVGLGGQNYQRYSNPEADRLVERIRETKDEAERMKAYKDVQKVIAEDYPIIYLFSQQLRIVGDNNIALSISDKRPGYFVNAIAEE